MQQEHISDVKDVSSIPEVINMESLSLLQKVTDQTATLEEIAPDIAFMKILLVNVCFIGTPGEQSKWVLIDTGLPDSAEAIKEAAEKRFGPHNPPQAIILTHGHFDHVGSVIGLSEQWKVPVYAHEAELPFLTGKQDYLQPDPGASGGLLAKMSPLFPNHAINLGNRVQALPANGEVSGAREWRWVHTPGHTPGHTSLFREKDRFLFVADAFTTVKQESLWAVLTQEKELHGPPSYFTTEWQQAWESVKALEALKPQAALSSHGQPMFGEELTNQLHELAENFDKEAIPEHGRYVP